MDSENLQREIRILRKQLTRSEADREELETNKEKDETLLRKVILELRISQQELNSKSSELENTLSELNTAQDELIQSAKMAALGELVAGISHEINTPVGVSVTAASHLQAITEDFTAALKNKELTANEAMKFAESAEESTDMILRNLQRAADLVRNFKQIAVDRSFEGPREFNVAEYLNSILTSINAPIKKMGIKTELVGPDDLTIFSDPGLLSQVIINFVMNSLTHAYDGKNKGLITIAFANSGGRVSIEFHDDGNGIDAANIARIFDPFFTTRRGRGGSGLGLNIVYNIVVTKLKGTISCASKLGSGTTFKLLLPNLQLDETRSELDCEEENLLHAPSSP
ncbi:MAG: sensor histidine kinase [Oceanococcus sp.]